MNNLRWILFVVCALFSVNSLAQNTTNAQPVPKPSEEITNLDELLNAVRERQRQERAIGKKREREFLQARNQQKRLLEKARREFRLAQKHNNPLQKITEANAQQIAELQQQLDTRTREMGDVYSIFNEFSGDVSAALQESMTTVEFPERGERPSRGRCSHIRRRATARAGIAQKTGDHRRYGRPVVAVAGGYDCRGQDQIDRNPGGER